MTSECASDCMLMASLIRWVSPEDLPSLSKLHGTHGSHQHKVYGCLVGTEHLVERSRCDLDARDATSTVGTEHLVERSDAVGDTGDTGGTAGTGGTGGAAAAARFDPNLATRFDRAHYYTHPEAYVPTFHKTIAPHISVLVTTMYTWTVRLWPCPACKCSPRRLNPTGTGTVASLECSLMTR